MSDTVIFDAESRALVGKGAARAARRNGRVPAVVYGANKDPEPITIDPRQLRAARMQPSFFATLFDVSLDGNKQQVLCRDLQLHPVTDQPMHADFLRVTDSTTGITGDKTAILRGLKAIENYIKQADHPV